MSLTTQPHRQTAKPFFMSLMSYPGTRSFKFERDASGPKNHEDTTHPPGPNNAVARKSTVFVINPGQSSSVIGLEAKLHHDRRTTPLSCSQHVDAENKKHATAAWKNLLEGFVKKWSKVERIISAGKVPLTKLTTKTKKRGGAAEDNAVS